MKIIKFAFAAFAAALSFSAFAQNPLAGTTWEYDMTHQHVPGGGWMGGEEGTWIDVYDKADENKKRLILFTEEHYSFFFITDERPMRDPTNSGLVGGPNVTDEQKLAEYAGIDVEAGKYRVEGDTLYLMPILDQMPDRMVDDRHYRQREMEIVDGRLRITSRPSESRPQLATNEYYLQVE